jgi:ubiquinone/menaquinone biosynthesis C-methylase UbiE
MIRWLNKQAHHILIRVLLALKPEMFFDRLNALPWYQDTLRQWVKNNKLPLKSKILEVGCATGSLTTYLAESGYIPTGIDASNEMISRAKSHSNSITFLEASVEDLPFADDAFDSVICASLINILDEKERAIKEMNRVCKKGGTVSILVPSQKFTQQDFNLLNDSLALEGFSGAVLEAWNKLPPKMYVHDIESLLKAEELVPEKPQYYLQGMVFSITAKRLI